MASPLVIASTSLGYNPTRCTWRALSSAGASCGTSARTGAWSSSSTGVPDEGGNRRSSVVIRGHRAAREYLMREAIICNHRQSEVIRGNQNQLMNFEYLMREQLRGHQEAIKGPSRGHPEAIKRPSRGHQEAIKRSSSGHQEAIKRPSSGHQEAIKWPSRGHQEAIKLQKRTRTDATASLMREAIIGNQR